MLGGLWLDASYRLSGNQRLFEGTLGREAGNGGACLCVCVCASTFASSDALSAVGHGVTPGCFRSLL